ncbi:MAG: acetoacetate--CoA ligase, partial [Proteobacteria bacterium]|nr:acetoacetate--CoA ligase [Pseudomonadota bacterium]
SPTPYAAGLADDRMPGAVWFPGVQINYARHALRHVEAADAAGQPAIIAEDESGRVTTLSWPDLRRKVSALALKMRELGIAPGDRIAAYLPNRPEAAIAFLACAAVGAVWSICSPDMGVPAILDRFRQIEPKLLIATDGVTYAGKRLDRAGTVRELRQALPSVRHLLLVESGLSADAFPDAVSFEDATRGEDQAVAQFQPTAVAFDHPLWIVYSSGTTGKPKGLVHSHGGILLSAAATSLHTDIAASYAPGRRGERFHWFSSTGWIMWNIQVCGLLGGTTICLYDGSPAGAGPTPDFGVLWRFAARHGVTFFGAGAAFYAGCLKSGLDFQALGDLSSIKALGSTGSPLPASVQIAVSEGLQAAGHPGVWWYNTSGGTDICGAFCTGNPDLPSAPGKLQCRQLGAAVEAWDEAGAPLVGAVGELVCVRPLPSMPIYLWGDEAGARYQASYFDKYPGVWRHGDWIRIDADGTCEIFGRSDATINRGGHRMGTSEIYDAVERLPQIRDALAIDVRSGDGETQLILLVVTSPEDHDTADLTSAVADAIRRSLSPRFVPDQVIEVAEIPRTLSGKKQELPVKRLFEGARLESVVDLSAMANPDSMAEMARLADAYRAEVQPA